MQKNFLPKFPFCDFYVKKILKFNFLLNSSTQNNHYRL